jgi:hypothetical protein
MLYHASFNVRQPEKVAQALAGMLDATAIRAPVPPFPDGSWFVCYGDDNGSFLEVLPWGNILDPDTRFGIGFDEGMRPRAGSHVLVRTPHAKEEIMARAERLGWRCEFVNARLFEVVKVWIDNAVLIEFLPPEFVPAYVSTFGAEGIRSLNRKLRAMEA